MTFQIGNKEGSKNKAGGRKSAYDEAMRARMLSSSMFEEFDQEKAIEILNFLDACIDKSGHVRMPKKRIGKLTLFQVYLAKAFLKNEHLLETLFKKVFPDKVLDETPTGESPASEIIKALFKASKDTKRHNEKVTDDEHD